MLVKYLKIYTHSEDRMKTEYTNIWDASRKFVKGAGIYVKYGMRTGGNQRQ